MSDLKYNFKTIEDIRVVESSDGGFLLLEKEGALRRILAKNLTAKSDITVNGISPDENGNIEIKSDITINGISPDENGNIEIKVATEQVQADMAENDSTKASYIQNRLCYETPSGEGNLIVEGPYAEIITEEGVPFAIGTHIFPEEDGSPRLKLNQTYLVRWMDKSYACKTMNPSVVGEENPDPNFVFLGNIRRYYFYVLSMSGEFSEEEIEQALDTLKLAKTEEPFFAMSIPDTLMVMNLDSNEMPEIQIFEQNFDVKTLDEKFIPDSIARVSDLDWNNLSNRPFGEEGTGAVIEWDGNTEGRDNFCLFDTMYFYKISELTPSLDELRGCTYTSDIGNEYSVITEGVVDGGGVIMCSEGIASIYDIEAASASSGVDIPSTGLYIFRIEEQTEFIIKISYGSTTINTIDEKFIPDTIARVSDIPQSGSGSSVQADLNQNDEAAPDYVKGRTHYEVNNYNVITWDGSTEGRDVPLHNGEPLGNIYKISDLVPVKDDLVGQEIEKVVNGEVTRIIIEESRFREFDGYTLVSPNGSAAFYIFYKTETSNGITVPSTGVYGIASNGNYVSKISYGSTTVKKLDEKFIPNTIARVNDIKEHKSLTISVNDKNAVYNGYNETSVVIDTSKDWNQNDENASDYIENRTHYVEYDKEELCRTQANVIGGNFDKVSPSVTVDFDSMFSDHPDSEIYIELDGVNHLVTSNDLRHYDTITSTSIIAYTYFGNLSLCRTNDGMVENTGEDWCLACYRQETTGGSVIHGMFGYIPNPSGEWPWVVIYSKTPIVHQLDEKFIPDTIARVNQIPTIPPTSWNDLQDRPFYSEPMEPVDYENASIEVSTNMSPVELEDFPLLTASADYLVTVNQTEYELSAKLFTAIDNGVPVTYMGNTAALGISPPSLASSDDVPFLIMQGATGGQIITQFIKFSEVEECNYIRVINASDTVYHKIDPAYLPATSGSGLPAVSEQDEGKILMVKNGAWAITSLVNTEEVSY